MIAGPILLRRPAACRSLVFVLVSFASAACTGAQLPRCKPETRLLCACTSGESGVQTCLEPGVFGACQCEHSGHEPIAEPWPVPAGIAPLAEEYRGRQPVRDPPAPACPYPIAETCNEEDDDCDGEIDEGYVCPPDPVIRHSEPFRGGVYLTADDTREGRPPGVIRVWPKPSRFRPIRRSNRLESSAAGYFVDFDPARREFVGLYRVGDDLLLQTESGRKTYGTGRCQSKSVRPHWNARGDFFYGCYGKVYRNGRSIPDVRLLFGALADGRLIANLGATADLVVLDQSFKEVTRFPTHLLTGKLAPQSRTLVGRSAYYVCRRTDAGELPEEYVLIRLDAANQWHVVRRVPSDGRMGRLLGLPDGTILRSWRRGRGWAVEAIEASGPRVVWTSEEWMSVRGSSLLVGP